MATVAEQLALKMKLERRFAPEVARVFSRMANDFKVAIAFQGFPGGLDSFRGRWDALLDNHYVRAQNAFKGIALNQKQIEPMSDEEKEDLLAAALLAWRERNAPMHTSLILNTTRRNMFDAIEEARAQLSAEGTATPTQRELAVLSAALLARKFKGRITAIVMSETQAAAEAEKFIEVEVESGSVPSVLSGIVAVTKTTKHWRTVGDKNVRPIHARVNGQKRKLHEPFQVNGEFLKHPGDSSLGASAGNVANCRCIAEFSLN